ncbi:hypothetical protein F4809DRAFT_639214 [Biscogniauxia mediterranea]|nr:hypothetical protein F4809DRAFT_639214 [Biscogniauxia mediterranea]
MVPLPHAFQQLLKMGGDWESGLRNCTPLSSCTLGTFLLCFLVGRTSNRLLLPISLIPTMLNVDCLVHGILTCGGLGWIWVMLKRTEIRTRFAIPGNEVKDYCVAYRCTLRSSFPT